MITAEKKCRILLVIRWPVGGIRTFIRYVYNTFDPERYSFTILAPKGDETEIMMQDLKDQDICYIGIKENPTTAEFMTIVTKEIISEKYHLVHSHGITSGISSALPARLKGVRHLMTVHEVLLPKQFQGIKGKMKKVALASLLPLIDSIHSVSEDARNNLLEFLPGLKKSNGKCIVVPNGIKSEDFRCCGKRDFRRELGLQQDTFLIGFLGRFMSPKGFRYLIDAMELLAKNKNLPKYPLVLAFGYGGFIREDRQVVIKKGLEKHFHYLPFTADVGPVLKGLDVVTMPSLWEACPLLPMEVMVSGVPVIGTSCMGLREVLRDTPGVMVEPANGQALARAIESEIKNPSKQRAEAFIAEAAERFDVKKQAQKIQNVIEGLLAAAN